MTLITGHHADSRCATQPALLHIPAFLGEDGIAPGTRWDDIPDDWSCPDCGAAKADFEMVEVARS